jgi:hypothetical protein
MLTALLFNTLLEGIFPYVGVSFLLGMLIYWYALHTIRINTNDVAFKKALSHRLVAVLVSLNMLYVSFPFAPAFATHEWWTGYMQAEVKMLMENLCICGLTMFTLWDTMDKKTFYSISAFVVSQLVANLALLKYLSWSVHGQLEIRRRDGTTRLIAQELKNICRFIESGGQQANKTRRPRKKTVAVTKHYNQAAKVIQSAWRERSRKLSVLQAFGGGQGKSIGIARTTSFLSGTGRRSLTRSGSVTSFKRPSIDMIAEEVTSDDEVAVETIMSVPLQKRKQLNLGSRRNKKQPIVDLSASLGRLEEVSDDDE